SRGSAVGWDSMLERLALALADCLARCPDWAELCFQALKEGQEVATQKVANVPHLQRVQPPDATLDIAHERLRSGQLVRQGLLRHPGFDPELAEAPQQHFVFVSVDRLGHGHGLTAWPVTLYSNFRYLNSRCQSFCEAGTRTGGMAWGRHETGCRKPLRARSSAGRSREPESRRFRMNHLNAAIIALSTSLL